MQKNNRAPGKKEHERDPLFLVRGIRDERWEEEEEDGREREREREREKAAWAFIPFINNS